MASFRGLALRSAARGAPRVAAPRSYATLLIADHDNKSLGKATWQAAAAAAKLPGATSLDVLVLGKGCGDVAAEASKMAGVSKVLLAESDQLEHPVADTTAELLRALQKSGNFSVVSGVATSLAKETLPRVAAKLDV
jgi:electron transfer flavoprotein alpha subunit